MEECPIKNKPMNENAKMELMKVMIANALGWNLEGDSCLEFHNLGIPSIRKNTQTNNTNASAKYITRLQK
jgi:hypothetical protein